MAEDALSDLLRTVRLTGATFFEIAAADAWAIQSPDRQLILPKVLPGADHLIAYHVVTAGQCFGTVAGGEPILLEAGQAVVFTNADAHVMSSSPGLWGTPTTADVIEIATAGELPFCINCGDGGLVSTRLVCGYLACDAGPFNPLLENLPRVIKAGEADGNDPGWLGQFIRYAVAESAQKRAGHEIVLTKLSELMFIDLIRRHVQMLPPHETGWLAGLRDTSVSKALSLIHARPAHPWTLDELARMVGQSRSVLAERFVDTVGIPPIHYLSRWRIQIAAERLKRSNANLSEIAAEVGYESDSSLSRAFKRLTGMSPSAWRSGHSRNADDRPAAARTALQATTD